MLLKCHKSVFLWARINLNILIVVSTFYNMLLHFLKMHAHMLFLTLSFFGLNLKLYLATPHRKTEWMHWCSNLFCPFHTSLYLYGLKFIMHHVHNAHAAIWRQSIVSAQYHCTDSNGCMMSVCVCACLKFTRLRKSSLPYTGPGLIKRIDAPALLTIQLPANLSFSWKKCVFYAMKESMPLQSIAQPASLVKIKLFVETFSMVIVKSRGACADVVCWAF